MTYDLLDVEYLNCPEDCDSDEHMELVEWFVSINTDKDYGDAPSAGYHEGMLVPSYTNPGTNIHFTTKSLGNVTINQKAINITWNKLSGVYGSADIKAGEYVLDTALVAGDTIAQLSMGTVYYRGLTYTGEGISMLNVGDYKYDFGNIVFKNADGDDVSGNYKIASQTKGDYTITALTLNGKYVAQKAMEYTGDVIDGLYVYSIDEDISIPNEEMLTWEIKYYSSSDDVFADNNAVNVSVVGNYFAMARLVSVTGGNASVSNYDVSEIAWQQFAIDKATLSLESIDGYNESFAKTDVYDGTGANKLFTLADTVLTFNGGIVYNANKHGAITFTVTAIWAEDAATILNSVTEAGVYKVTLSVSGADNFKNAQFSDITLTVDKMLIERDDLYNYISISFKQGGYTYNALAQKPTVSIIDSAEATLSVRYYLLGENQQPQEVDEPINAGMYAIMIDYSARNYRYEDFAYLQNQVDQINTHIIARSSNIDLMISTGVQYYNGQTQRPDSMIVRMLPGTDQVEYK
ncbi:MAG: hypothetical protein K2I79_00310, partial [Clostridia bacterium]|nr:hypothetical protein [Clostridia bacterium]